MKILLSLQYLDILLPDEAGLQQVLKILGRGTLVQDRLYDGEIKLEDKPLRLEVKSIPPGTRFVRCEGATVIDVSVSEQEHTPKRKRVKGRTQLLLGGGT